MVRNQIFHETLIPTLAKGMGVSRYCELGVYQGDTLNRVAMALPPSALLVGVDTKAPAFLVAHVRFRQMTTATYFARHAEKDAPFDMVFIDADHSAASVLHDFEGIWPHVVDDGLVLLHDGNPETVADTDPGYCGDGWRAIKHLTSLHEAATLPFHPGLTFIRKRKLWGPADAPATVRTGEDADALVLG